MTEIIKRTHSYKDYNRHTLHFTFVRIGGHKFKLQYERGNSFGSETAYVLQENGVWKFAASGRELEGDVVTEALAKAGLYQSSWYGANLETHETANNGFVAAMIEHLEVIYG